MINLKIDTTGFNEKMNNAVQYTQGFAQGIQENRKSFNLQLGKYSLELLNKYIDTKARMSPDQLHHVYEWGQVGNPSSRLFEIETSATQANIVFYGRFLQSKSISDDASEPFINKAEIMENSIVIEVAPKSGGPLVFESEGETVFTSESIYIANPGGDAVSGSFGRVVQDFFENYYTNVVLIQSGIFSKLSTPIEYAKSFNAGVSGGGFGVGRNAGKRYLTVRGGSLL
jgi:hypothetical protein